MKKFFIVTLIFVADLSALGSAPKITSPQRIRLSRYSGHPGFHANSTLEWHQRGEKFFPADKGGHHMYANACESLLEMQQEFSLDRMVETNYVTPDRAREGKELAKHLQTGQVNFLEIFRAPETKTAALWTVAGQVWNTEKGQLELLNPPWAMEPKRKEFIEKHLDRKKYKYIWEWGRAAQIQPNEIEPLLSAAASINYAELRAMGGEIDDAYVTFHSLSPAATRAYLRRHPGRLFPPDWTDMGDAVILIPMREILEKYPPSSISAKVERLKQLAGPTMDDALALDFLTRVRTLRWQEMDFYWKNRRTGPVVMNDLSVGRPAILLGLMKGLKIPYSNAQNILDYLMPMQQNLHLWDSGQYKDVTDNVLSHHDCIRRNAVEISNMDSTLARQDPEYVLGAVLASFLYYVDNATGYSSNPQDHQIILSNLRQTKIQFAFTTWDPEIHKTLMQLHPSESIERKNPPVDPRDFASGIDGADWWLWGSLKTMHTHFFTVDQLISLGKANPKIGEAVAGNNVQMGPGSWQRAYWLADPDIF